MARPFLLSSDSKTLTPGLLRPVDAFISHLRADGASPHTIAGYESDLRQFAGWLRGAGGLTARQGWKQVSYLTLRRYLVCLTEHYSRLSTIRKLVALKAFFKWMEHEGHIRENPARQMRSPKTPVYAPDVLEIAEIERLLEAPDLLDAAGKRDRALLEVLYATGMRCFECAALNLGDVNWRAGQIRVRDAKGREVRTVLLGRPAQAALRDYLRNARPELLRYEERTEAKLAAKDPNAALLRRAKQEAKASGQKAMPTCDALWLSRRGRPMTAIAVYHVVRQCARQAGLSRSVTTHTLRHSCAAHLLRNGADLSVVQELLGHRNLASTLVYERTNALTDVSASVTPRRRGRSGKGTKAL